LDIPIRARLLGPLFVQNANRVCSCQDESIPTIPDFTRPTAVDVNESFYRLMIPSDVDKATMPDGNAVGSESLHAESILPAINGDQYSPLAAPESPEDKGIIRCMSHSHYVL
jgi:hypothetical protein